MKYYQDIKLLQTTEDICALLWQKVYTQVHLALVEAKDSDNKVQVAISFPEYCYEERKTRCIGNKLRLFARSHAVLQQLDIMRRLSNLTDYVASTAINEVPMNKHLRYVQFRRCHIKGNPEKLARRYAKRHRISFDEAIKYYQNTSYVSDLPYIQLKSLSNQQDFRLYIEKREHSELIQDGFSTYGLSSVSTVPEF